VNPTSPSDSPGAPDEPSGADAARDSDPAFDESLLDQLAPYLSHLQAEVRLVVWGDENLSETEKEAMRLAAALSGRFPAIQHAFRPRRANYAYYPVIGVMQAAGDEEVDYRVRIIGLPAGVMINGLVGAIQAVSFNAGNLETGTRIRLKKLSQPVALELLTVPSNEAGAVLTTLISAMAVASPHIEAYTVMADQFPAAALRYSVRNLPHIVINRRYHVAGLVDEEALLSHIARATGRGYGSDEAE
jgi:alkyl hydroperoxide reductase subunit AhpF